MDYLTQTGILETSRLKVRSDQGYTDIVSTDDTTESNNEWHDDTLSHCLYHKKQYPHCSICSIFDETRLSDSIGDPIPAYIVECLCRGGPYTGDPEDSDRDDRFHVYQCGPAHYAVMDELRYLDSNWTEDPVIELTQVQSGTVASWYEHICHRNVQLHDNGCI